MSQGLSAMIAELERLAKEQGGGKRIPPVDQWNPAYCGDVGIEIRADGTWWHQGGRMTREALVRLFASVLRKDADGLTYLVTPGEKILVRVEDAPFLAVRVDRAGEGRAQTLVFTTNMGDVVAAGPDHPIRVRTDPETQEPRPYVRVRGRLEARILRAPFYEMVEWAEERGDKSGVWSNDIFFEIGAAGGETAATP
jgi:hypothetical protein